MLCIILRYRWIAGMQIFRPVFIWTEQLHINNIRAPKNSRSPLLSDLHSLEEQKRRNKSQEPKNQLVCFPTERQNICSFRRIRGSHSKQEYDNNIPWQVTNKKDTRASWVWLDITAVKCILCILIRQTSKWGSETTAPTDSSVVVSYHSGLVWFVICVWLQ